MTITVEATASGQWAVRLYHNAGTAASSTDGYVTTVGVHTARYKAEAQATAMRVKLGLPE